MTPERAPRYWPSLRNGSLFAVETVMERRAGYRALVVEDDDAILRLVKTVLDREGFVVEGVRNGLAAITLLDSVAYDLLIVDLMLPHLGGEEVLGHLELTQPAYLRRVIVVTASPRRMSCEFLERICRLLEKPFDIEKLVLYARECAQGDCDDPPAAVLSPDV
jgi:DNA-binding response OmpR family regulator